MNKKQRRQIRRMRDARQISVNLEEIESIYDQTTEVNNEQVNDLFSFIVIQLQAMNAKK